MTERSLQVKVGALILISLVLLVAFIFLLGTFSVGAQRTYFIEVTDSGSILRGAPVKVAGVRAGRVEDVEFLVARDARKSRATGLDAENINVRLRVSVDEKMAQAVRQDSEFYITTQGVLGEKYLEIVPGSATSEAWRDGAYIRGKDPARIDLIFAKASNILGKVETALGGEGGEGVSIGNLVTSLTKLSQNVDGILVDHRARLDRIAVNVETTTADASQLVGYLRQGVGSAENVSAIVGNVQTVSGVFAEESRPLVASVKKTLATVDETASVARDVVVSNREAIDGALANLLPITQSARVVMRDAAAITQGIGTGRGTIGQLIVDQEIYDDLKEMLRDLKRHPWKMLWKE